MRPNVENRPQKLLLLGCGVMSKEISWLAKKNQWPLECQFLSPALHIDLHELASSLQAALAQNQQREMILFYGMCHPMLSRMLQPYHITQIAGENCIEMLLGSERYRAELASGAFFLTEEWASTWDTAIAKTFGNNPEVVREIFKHSQSYLLGLRTPCSSDFSSLAQTAGRSVDLPVLWMDSGLEHLEALIQQKIDEVAWQI